MCANYVRNNFYFKKSHKTTKPNLDRFVLNLNRFSYNLVRIIYVLISIIPRA